jgi:hypothetical protein
VSPAGQRRGTMSRKAYMRAPWNGRWLLLDKQERRGEPCWAAKRYSEQDGRNGLPSNGRRLLLG